MRLLFTFFVFVVFELQAGAVWLLNDAPYPLTAVITSASGKQIGKISLKAGEQNTWVTSLSAYKLESETDPQISQTPYSVTWKCPHGGFYSVCNPVSPGGLVTANLCNGAHYCRPPPPKKKKEPIPQCKCECDCGNEKKESEKSKSK